MECTDYVPFNNASGSASVNILAATVRTNLPPGFVRTHRDRRGWEGHRSDLVDTFARSFQKRQQPSGGLHTVCLVLGFRRHRLILTSLPHGVEKGDVNVGRLQRGSQDFGRAQPQCLQIFFPFTRTLHDDESVHLRRAGQ